MDWFDVSLIQFILVSWAVFISTMTEKNYEKKVDKLTLSIFLLNSAATSVFMIFLYYRFNSIYSK